MWETAFEEKSDLIDCFGTKSQWISIDNLYIYETFFISF